MIALAYSQRWNRVVGVRCCKHTCSCFEVEVAIEVTLHIRTARIAQVVLPATPLPERHRGEILQ